MLTFALTGLLNGITSTLLGIFVFSRNPKNPVYSTYGLFCLSIAVWGYSYFLWLTSTTPDAALFWSKMLMLGAIFIPTTYLHHILILLNKAQINRPLILFGYIFGFFAAITDQTPFFVSGVHPKLFFVFWPEPGILFTPFLLIWFAYVIYGIFIIFKNFLESRGAQRNQIKIVFVATIIGWAGGATNYPLWYGIPLPPYGNILVSLYILITAYAILHHRLLDIEVIIKRSFVFTSLVSAVVAVYAFSLYITQLIFQQALGISQWIASIITIIAILIGYKPLESFLAAITDKFFFMKKYEYRTTLKNLAQGLAQLMPLKTFIMLLLRNVVRIVKLNGGIVILYDDVKAQYMVSAAERQSKPLLGKIIPKDNLFAYI